MNKKNTEKFKDLTMAILSLKNETTAKAFLRDLMTEKEIIEFGNRWKTAQMLFQNIPYVEIEKETGLSSTTIARVSKWLKSGKGGYATILKNANSVHHHNSSSRGKELC